METGRTFLFQISLQGGTSAYLDHHHPMLHDKQKLLQMGHNHVRVNLVSSRVRLKETMGWGEWCSFFGGRCFHPNELGRPCSH